MKTTDGENLTRVTVSSGTVSGPNRPVPPADPTPGLTPRDEPSADLFERYRLNTREKTARTIAVAEAAQEAARQERLKNIEGLDAAVALAPHMEPFASMQEVAAAMADERYKDVLDASGRQYRALVLARIAAMDDAKTGIHTHEAPPAPRDLSEIHPGLAGPVNGYVTHAQIIEAARQIRTAHFSEQPALQKVHEARIAATDYSRLL